MARPKKDGKTVSLIMQKDLYEKLQAYCDETYLTKTAAIEKSLQMLFDRYEERKAENKSF